MDTSKLLAAADGHRALSGRGRVPEKVGMGRAHRLATPAPGRVVLWQAAPEHQVSEL